MCLNLFSSCRLLCPARLPLSKLSLGGGTPLEKIEKDITEVKSQITQYGRRLDVLENDLVGKSDKQEQDLRHEKLLILKALEQLRDEKLLLLKKQMLHSSTPAPLMLYVFVFPLCFSNGYLPFSNPLPFFSSPSFTVSSQHA